MAVLTSTAEAYIKAFKDKFSNHSDDYASYRPTYPDSLAEFLASQASGTQMAVDVACGSGQLTKSLGRVFQQVYGFDASAEQIQQTTADANITYAVSQAESLPLTDNSVDIITVAQALHWFDIDAFWAEAKRIGKQGSLVAAICYQLCQVEGLNPIIKDFYESLRSYWAAERSLIDSAYSTIPFPFDEVKTPNLTMEHNWTGSQFLSYIGTWSAVKAAAKNNDDSFTEFKNALQSAWDSAECKRVTFPLCLRVGRI